MPSVNPNAPSPSPPYRRGPWPYAFVVAAGLAAWWGVWTFGYKFDDLPAIVDNEALAAGDWWDAALGPAHQPLANRPFATATLAIGFAVAGPGAGSALFGNLLLHLANGCLLFAVVRAVLAGGNLAGVMPAVSATRAALALACLWVAHPLGADTVAYATQRSTALGSACLLLALWALATGGASPSPGRRHALAAGAMALACASKEDFVVGPLLALLFDRAFLQPSWSAVCARWRLHASIAAAAWGVLAVCLALGPANDTVGYDTAEAVTAWQWLLTQAAVLVHYLRLAAWPTGLRGAYDWGIVTSLGPAVAPGLIVLALLAVTVVAWRRAPHWGFLGAMFFLYLAPTSSVMPIVTEVVAERRAYLPMLLVLAPAVFGARGMLRRCAGPGAAWAVAVAAVAGLAALAHRHADSYRDDARFWADAYGKRDPAVRNAFTTRIVGAYASVRFAAGEEAAAHALFDELATLPSPTAAERLQLASSLQRRDRHQEALAVVDRVLVEAPTSASAHGLRGAFVARELERRRAGPSDPGWDAAARSVSEAVRLDGSRPKWRFELARIREAQGRLADAERVYAEATATSNCPPIGLALHDQLLRRLGRDRDADALWRDALDRRRDEADVWVAGAQAAAAAKDVALARERLLVARRLAPGRADIEAGLARLAPTTR